MWFRDFIWLIAISCHQHSTNYSWKEEKWQNNKSLMPTKPFKTLVLTPFSETSDLLVQPEKFLNSPWFTYTCETHKKC